MFIQQHLPSLIILIVDIASFHVKQINYGCHGEMIERKSENLVQILQYQTGAITIMCSMEHCLDLLLVVPYFSGLA